MEKEIEVKNKNGLHARLAAVFVQTASKFTSNIWITKDSKKVNAKSIMGIMSLAIPSGETITLLAEGEDEEEAIKELDDLLSE